MRGLLWLVLALGLAGCAPTNLAKILEAAGKDPATVSVNIKTIYGTVQYCRTAIQNGNVVCAGDGITVKTESAQVGIPLTVVPSVTIGQPTIAPPSR